MPAAPLDELANEFRFLVLAVQAEGERRLNDSLRERGLDLTATQSEVLEVLYQEGPLDQSALGERLVCTKGNISRLLDRMSNKQLVMRQKHPHDRRRLEIALTPKGEEAVEAAFDVISDLLAAIRELYSDKELRQMTELLARLSKAFGVEVVRGQPGREATATS